MMEPYQGDIMCIFWLMPLVPVSFVPMAVHQTIVIFKIWHQSNFLNFHYCLMWLSKTLDICDMKFFFLRYNNTPTLTFISNSSFNIWSFYQLVIFIMDCFHWWHLLAKPSATATQDNHLRLCDITCLDHLGRRNKK